MNYKDIVLTNLGSLNKKYMVVFKAMVDVTALIKNSTLGQARDSRPQDLNSIVPIF